MQDALKRYLEELERFQHRVDELYRRSVQGAAGGSTDQPGGWEPPADVVELEEEWLISVELPGVKRDQIRLQAEGEHLLLEGRREPPDEALGFERMERVHGPFRRLFRLNGEIDAEGIEARYRRGVLDIRVPRSRRRSVEVSSAESEEE